MSTVLLLGLFTFVLSGLLTRSVRRFFLRRAILEIPNHRSSHVQPTPKSGGIGFALAATLSSVVLAVLYYLNGLWPLPQLAVALGVTGVTALLGLVGLRDDLRPLPARIRLFAQTLAVAAVFLLLQPVSQVVFPWFTLHSMWLLLPMLVFGVWWINAFNFMDGIDGIALSQALFVLAALVLLNVPAVPVSGFLILLLAALTAFIPFNWPPAKIFMGDVGSYFLGLSLLVSGLLMVKHAGGNYWEWFILNAFFLLDTLITLCRRLLAGHRYSEAHRNHFYQKLARLKKSHLYSTLFTLTVNLFWLFPLTWLAHRWPVYGLYLFLGAYAPLALLFYRKGAGMDDRAQPALSRPLSL